MRVFVAGATAVIGQYLVPGLVAPVWSVTDVTAAATVAAVTRATSGYPSWRDGSAVWAQAFKSGAAA